MVFFHCQVPPLVVTSQSSASPSKAALVRLLTKIRKQKDHGTTRSESSDASKEVTIESGSITSDKTKQGTSSKSATNASVSEEHPELLSVPSHYNKRKFCFKKILFEILFRFHFHQNLYLTVMWPGIFNFLIWNVGISSKFELVLWVLWNVFMIKYSYFINIIYHYVWSII